MTRSGNIMRKDIEEIASGEIDPLGDTSTMAILRLWPILWRKTVKNVFL